MGAPRLRKALLALPAQPAGRPEDQPPARDARCDELRALVARLTADEADEALGQLVAAGREMCMCMCM